MFNFGIKGRTLRIIKDMYSKVKSFVRSANKISDFFQYAVGLQLGEVLSPLLFSLFVEDLELYLQDRITCGLNIDDINIILLLFADDMVLVGNSPVDLQCSLDRLYQYCSEWGLTVNIFKTKIVVFRKRGNIRPEESWTYNNEQIEVVNDFNYLGVVFNYAGSFILNQEALAGKGLKALRVLLANTRKCDFNIKTLCQLFDSFVGSILSYGCEVWGFSKSKELERIHLKFCKTILKAKTCTSNAGGYGDMCRYPLYIGRYVRIIRYWCKLVNTNNVILSTIYNTTLEDVLNGQQTWAGNVKCLLGEFGFANVWLNPDSINLCAFPSVFKQRLIDCFIQKWQGDLQNNGVLTEYKQFKMNFSFECYLNIFPVKHRVVLTKLRLSAHSLLIDTGRYGRNRIIRNERQCALCDTGDLKDEHHFTLVCSKYNDIRKFYLKRYYYTHPSVFKFIQLMQSNNIKELKKLCKYLFEAFNIRKTHTHH